LIWGLSGGDLHHGELMKKSNVDLISDLRSNDLCPNCLNKSLAPASVTFGCAGCGNTFPVDLAEADSSISIDPEDAAKIMNNIVEIFKTQRFAEAMEDDLNNDFILSEDNITSYSVLFQDKILDAIKQTKKDCKIDTLMNTVTFIISGFLFVLKAVLSMPGKEVYMVDDLGTRTKDIRNNIFGLAKETVEDQKNKLIVEKFINHMALALAMKENND
jgi:hypothetical protein